MAKAETKATIPPARIELYEKLIRTQAEAERKGKGMPSTSFNGHMFSFLSPTGSLFLRLPEKEKEAFIKKYKSSASGGHAKMLMEFVEVPEKLMKDFAEVKKYFDISFTYVQTLKPR